MKIGERIKKVLEMNPEIQRNRAKLRAIFYLQKKNPKTMRISIVGSPSSTDVSLEIIAGETHNCFSTDYRWGNIQIANVNMKPLSSYPATKGEAMITDALRDTSGVVIEGLKEIWEQFEAKKYGNNSKIPAGS